MRHQQQVFASILFFCQLLATTRAAKEDCNMAARSLKSPMVVQVPGATATAAVIWMHGNSFVLFNTHSNKSIKYFDIEKQIHKAWEIHLTVGQASVKTWLTL
jgi:copper(I)-binding protein